MNTPYTPFSPPAHFWKKSGWSLFQLVMNGLIKSALVIASYFLIKSASAGIRSDSLVYSESVWILSLVAFSFIILRVHERYTSEKMSQKYINRVRSVLLKRLMRASVRSVQTMSVGAMSSRLGGDLSAVKKWLSLGIARLISHGLLLSIFSLLMININLYLGLVMLFSMGLLVTVSMIIGKQLKTSIKSVRKNRIKIHSMLVERLSSIITIRALGQELSEIKKINKNADKLKQSVSENGFWLGLLRGLGDASSLILICMVFAFQATGGHPLNVDEMMALISIILFINSPIRELARVHEYYQGAEISLKKLKEVFSIPRIVRGSSKTREVKENFGEVILRNIKFEKVFKGLSLRAKAGDHVAITGKNGSGKSTLLHLITGLVKQQSGTIKVNGVNPRLTNTRGKSAHIGFCGADTNLIKSTLSKNLTYRGVDYSKDEFNSLLEFCQIDEISSQLPKGLNTLVKEGGRNFSSGEKCRISLFRAMLGRPEILILDEPENYLDSMGFEIVKKILRDYQGTVLIATHNKELISLCNRKWQLDKERKSNIKMMKRL